MQSGSLSLKMDWQFPNFSLQLLGRRYCICVFWRLSTTGYPLPTCSILRPITPENLDWSPQIWEYRTRERRLKGNLAPRSLSSASAALFWFQLFFWACLWVFWYYRAWRLGFRLYIIFLKLKFRERNGDIPKRKVASAMIPFLQNNFMWSLSLPSVRT